MKADMKPKPTNFDHWRSLYRGWYSRVEAAATELGHPLGFNPLLLSSIESFEAVPRLMLATLNPGGNRDYPDHRGLWRYESGNAYTDVNGSGLGPGQSPLQRQIQRAFKHLSTRTGFIGSDHEFARANIVTAQIVPFRSPNEAVLHRRDESLEFSQNLWSEIFTNWRPQAVVSISGTTTREFGKLLGNEISRRQMPTGWGNIQMNLVEFERGTRLLGLPHLSRFALFGRPASEPHLEEAFDWLLRL